MSWDINNLIDGIGGLFGSGAGDSAGLVGVTPAAAEALPLPLEWLSPEQAAALGDAGSSGSGWNWGCLLSGAGTVARVAAPVGGALPGVSANNSAARTHSDASTLAAQIQAKALLRSQQMGLDATREAQDRQEAAAQRGIAASGAGTTNYADTIAPLLVERPVSLPTYRGLTQAEQIARDLNRNSQAILAASGLRGAGRAGVASVMEADRRFVANATQTNDNWRLSALQAARSSADRARTGLATVRAQEGGAIANPEVGQGNRIAETGLSGARTEADLTGTIGGVQAQNELTQGTVSAGADTANANPYSDALGTLGSVFANAGKSANSDRCSANDRWV